MPPPTHAEVPAVHEVAGALADIEASNCSEAVKLPQSHGVVLPNPRSSDGDIPDSTIRRMMRRAGIVASRHGAGSQNDMPRLSAFGQYKSQAVQPAAARHSDMRHPRRQDEGSRQSIMLVQALALDGKGTWHRRRGPGSRQHDRWFPSEFRHCAAT